ncbi:MAG: glycyl-radical enzyme activating protein [Deltaproteobacteria bacterium]
MKSLSSFPLIFNIRHGSIDDGTGIRTVAFLKGCPLNCIWCHNPESINHNAEMAFYSEQCVECSQCLVVCPNGAIDFRLQGRINRKKCISCGRCAEVCPSIALKKIGRFYEVNELVEILKLDKEFYKVSGGGVTFSGGEPLVFMDYVADVMSELKKEKINIAVQTSGFFDYSIFKEKIMGYVDTVYFDIKILDAKLHKKYTGVDNSLILNNFLNIVKEENIKVIPRIPLIPGITALPENLLAIADFIRGTGCSDYSLLTYNTGGISKRLSLQKSMSEGIPEYIHEEKQWKGIFESRFKR